MSAYLKRRKFMDKVVFRKRCAAINKKACQVVKELKSKEAELIRVLQEVDEWGVQRALIQALTKITIPILVGNLARAEKATENPKAIGGDGIFLWR